ncbi:unnamed protein product [Parascedosporium putredinis]|uniref:Uncharacterized protein n=1 Tax=Parascedosporium putredinis TaxID=1442378 RepID=A0A9P1H9I6_9PEZI|nr:unnamed protein product [Parascedosporium putredinis]CAI8000915.1 unnamed protein product [Parascedosporium putredinis]
MSVLQSEDLVSYQLRSSYLDDIADGVGERLITLNDGFLNSAAYKAAGWRTNHALSKRTHSSHTHRHCVRIFPSTALSPAHLGG